MARVTCPNCTGSFWQGCDRIICCSTPCYIAWSKRMMERKRLAATKETMDGRNSFYRRSAVGYRVVEVNPKEWWNGA
jgi:hypothetical protein